MTKRKEHPQTPKFTPEQRTAAVDYYCDGHSAAETARKFGCGKGTVSTWTKKAGRDKGAGVREQTEAATRAHVDLTKEKRAEARLDLAIACANFARLLAEAKDLPMKEVWQATTAVKVLTEVIRLEEGQTTSSEEVSHRYPDIAAMSDDELDAEIVREAERITRGEAG